MKTHSKVNIYAGLYHDYTLNTLCASDVFTEGVFSCTVSASYVNIVVVNHNSVFMRIAEWRVYAEPEIGHLAVEVSSWTSTGYWNTNPLQIAFGYPLNTWSFIFPILNDSSRAIVKLPQFYTVTSVIIVTSWDGTLIGGSFDSHQMSVAVNDSNYNNYVWCSPSPGNFQSLNFVEFTCSTYGDQVIIESSLPYVRLRRVAIFGPKDCTTGYGVTLTIPNQTARIGDAAATYTFSTSTACGLANFTTLQTYPWLSISANVAAQTATITILPTLNSEVGSYTLTLKMLLNNFPTATGWRTTFLSKILFGCSSGLGVTPLTIPNQTATVGQASSIYTFSTMTNCGPGIFSISPSQAWLDLNNNDTIDIHPQLNSQANVYS